MIVEDEGITAFGMAASLEEMGYTVVSTVLTGEEAVRKAEGEKPDLILMDINLSGKMDGIEAACQMRSRLNIPVVYITAHSEDTIFQRAKDTNPFGYIVKPFDDRELRIAIEMALYKHKTDKELRKYRDHLMELVEERTAELRNINEELEQEIAERMKVEAEIRKANELLENIFSNVHVLIAYMDADFNFIRVNRKYAEADEREPGFYVGKNHFDLFPNEENEAIFRRVVQTGESYFVQAKPFSYVHNPERGTSFWDWSLRPVFDARSKVSGLILSLMDVTDNITMYGELMRADHLSSIGKLASGVAHEINNPINGIINYAQLLANKSPDNSREKEIAKQIIKESDRIATIVRSLLSFARDNKGERSPVYADEILSDSFALIEAQLKKNGIELHVHIPSDLPPLFVNKQQIEQVFLNIISNALYTLNEKYPLADKNKVLEIYAEERTDAGSASVRLTFKDMGTGIPPDIIDKLINPFFTTKPVDSGTGLGLSISHGIIVDHGGKISFKSIEGESTSVIIDLPLYKK